MVLYIAFSYGEGSTQEGIVFFTGEVAYLGKDLLLGIDFGIHRLVQGGQLGIKNLVICVGSVAYSEFVNQGNRVAAVALVFK